MNAFKIFNKITKTIIEKLKKRKDLQQLFLKPPHWSILHNILQTSIKSYSIGPPCSSLACVTKDFCNLNVYTKNNQYNPFQSNNHSL